MQCTPLLVEKAGVSPDMTSESLHTSKKECMREIHSGFETHEEDTRSPKQEQSVAPQNGPWSNNFF